MESIVWYVKFSRCQCFIKIMCPTPHLLIFSTTHDARLQTYHRSCGFHGREVATLPHFHLANCGLLLFIILGESDKDWGPYPTWAWMDFKAHVGETSSVQSRQFPLSCEVTCGGDCTTGYSIHFSLIRHQSLNLEFIYIFFVHIFIFSCPRIFVCTFHSYRV